MNIRNIFITIFVCMALNISGNTCVIEAVQILNPAMVKVLIEYCHRESPDNKNIDNISVFVRKRDRTDAEYWKTIGDVRKWDLQEEQQDNRMKILTEHSAFFQQLDMAHGVLCVIASSDKREQEQIAIVMGTIDCSKCELVRKYYEGLQKTKNHKLWGLF